MQIYKTRERKFVEVKGIFDIRWSESQFAAVKNFLKGYPELHELFESIASDKEFDAEVRITAGSHFLLFASLPFYAILSLMADLLQILTNFSKFYQYEAGTLIGASRKVEETIRELEDLKSSDGPFLNGFYNNLFCSTISGTAARACGKNLLFNNPGI